MSIDYVAIGPEITLTITALLVLAADTLPEMRTIARGVVPLLAIASAALFAAWGWGDVGIALAPALLAGLAGLLLLGKAAMPGRQGRFSALLAGIGAVVALIWTATLFNDGRVTFGTGNDAMFHASNFAVVFKLVFLVALIAVLLISYRFFAEGRYFQTEYYFLLLVSFLGMMLMPSARDLVMLFVALETVSIPAFVMSGMRKRDVYSSEASIKFFLIGVLSVALMLFGMSMIYGFTGETNLYAIAESPAMQQGNSLLLASVLLVIVGFGFKISAVPFHFWAPDTYSGSPMPVAAMLAVASKAAGFAGLINVTFIAFAPVADVWGPALGVLAIITMFVGNLIALQQRDIIRLLGYSSVAQAGYMLVPFGVAMTTAQDTTLVGATGSLNDTSAQSVLFYLATYAVMNIGAFAVAIVLHRRTGQRRIQDFAGLGPRSPMLGMAMAIFLLSLAGIPPMVGFWSKFAVFTAAVNVGSATGSIFAYVLASSVAINSVIAMFYYLRIVKLMWIDPAKESAPLIRPTASLRIAVVGLAIATLVFGILPSLISNLTSQSPVATAVASD